MDSVVNIITNAETRIDEILERLAELKRELQSLQDEKHVLLAVLEAAKKAEQEVTHIK